MGLNGHVWIELVQRNEHTDIHSRYIGNFEIPGIRNTYQFHLAREHTELQPLSGFLSMADRLGSYLFVRKMDKSMHAVQSLS